MKAVPMKAVFLDRDGVLIQDAGYPHRTQDLQLLEGVGPAVSQLNRAGYIVIVVSNQSGVARGYFSENDLLGFEKQVETELRKQGGRIDGFYYCPHLPEAKVKRYAVVCDCRKPRPGLLLRAAREHKINPAASWMVGDKCTDIEAGKAAGCRTILIGSAAGCKTKADHAAKDLPEAVKRILGI